ncbi:hypothetical protein TI05_12100 [Achromatium sp. WMS3]|nr:hypothetical protein TI05_12100 [Achromatium sp. WMS3]
MDTIDTKWIHGERFNVTYRITAADNKIAQQIAENICIEQTVEVPRSLIPAAPIGNWIIGNIEQFTQQATDTYQAIISYPVELAAGELPQLLNIILGNSSLMPGIRVDNVTLPPTLVTQFKGPRFGVAGWRKLLEAKSRPLLATAIKPVGLSIKSLVRLAYEMTLGGIDIIKDDHGLTNQPFGLYAERVTQVCTAVKRANMDNGGNTLYLPNITGPIEQLWERAKLAKQEGAGGLLVAPGLLGFDTMRALADDDTLALPIMAHPTFVGAFVANPSHGISHGILFGLLARLAGADATIFTNYGGRFAFSIEDCVSIATSCLDPIEGLKTILPVPAGGMTFERIPNLHQTYGLDVIYLIGGALVEHSPDLVTNCRVFRELVQQQVAQ